jgi:hypothetical protein
MARGFLVGLLVGNTRPQHATQLLATHTATAPVLTAMHAPSLAAMLLGGPQSAALAASLMGTPPAAPPPAATPPPDKPPPARAPPARPPLPEPPFRGVPAGVYGLLTDVPSRPGFRTDPSGLLYHMQWYSGEYSVPPGWLPAPGARATVPPPPPPGAGAPPSRTPISAQLVIPVARPIVGSSCPFATVTTQCCVVCQRPGHSQYECPKRFYDTYGRPLPGHLPNGDQDPSAWSGGDLTPAARAALVAYLSAFGVTAHRKYGVTLAHISSGTAPALQA